MADVYGVTSTGFVLKRLNDILSDIATQLNNVQDPVTGENLIFNLSDENDPLVQVVNAVADQISVCWEQLQICYDQHDPLKATGSALSGTVQLNSLIRSLNETDTHLRARQQLSTEITSRSMIEDIYANVLNAAGVTFCRVYQNNTLTTDARGIPGKAVAVVAVGGEDLEIANLIFNHSSVGLNAYGSTTIYCADAQGFQYPISFSRPTDVPIYLIVNISVADDNVYPPTAEDQIKAAIVNYAQLGASSVGIATGYDQAGFIPGSSIMASEIYVPVNSIPGVKINSVKIGRAASPTDDNVAIAWNENPVFSVDDITVTVV